MKEGVCVCGGFSCVDYYAYGVCAESFEDQKAVFVSGVDCAPTVFR